MVGDVDICARGTGVDELQPGNNEQRCGDSAGATELETCGPHGETSYGHNSGNRTVSCNTMTLMEIERSKVGGVMATRRRQAKVRQRLAAMSNELRELTLDRRRYTHRQAGVASGSYNGRNYTANYDRERSRREQLQRQSG